MSDLPPVEGRVYILQTVRGADGRLVEIEAVPPSDATADMVPTWDVVQRSIVWRTPEELGFAPSPMQTNVLLTDGTGAYLVEGDGLFITANFPTGV